MGAAARLYCMHKMLLSRRHSPHSYSALSCPPVQLRGSKAVEAANERFDATMSNVVRWQEAPGGGGGLQIVSETFIQVQLVVPGWFVLPTASIERTGSAVMERVLQTAVPRFLQQLAADYAAWAAGDESRQPVNSDGLLPEGGLQDAASGEEEDEQGWD
jgi:hypothetical protein